ncbi:MAG: DUF4367 domain-containing protein [Lachnospiraceae bacterium]|nr:DUF4367 domain-containing protein [Lachnospiraceae bacterium]
MTDQELDRIMRRVLIDSMKLEEEGEGNGPVFEPSLRHRRRMRAMLANPLGWLRGRERPLWRQAVRRAAVFLVVCGMTLAGAMAFSPAARTAMVRWVVERSGNDIDYVYAGEGSEEDLPQYEITELPEGFVETERDVLPGLVDVIYESPSGDVIWLSYVFMRQGALTSFDTKDANAFDVTVNQLPGTFFEARTPGNLNTLRWIDPDLNMHFTVDGCFDLDVLLHMAESISLCKTPN